jgi:hypothetical protein
MPSGYEVRNFMNLTQINDKANIFAVDRKSRQ